MFQEKNLQYFRLQMSSQPYSNNSTWEYDLMNVHVHHWYADLKRCKTLIIKHLYKNIDSA